MPPVVATGDPDHAGLHNKTRAVLAEIKSALDSHETGTDPHGDRAFTTSAVATHTGATDPHGDRAFSTAAVSAHVADLDHGSQPTEQALLAWSYDPDMAGHVTAQSNGGVAGRITLTKIQIRKTITWSNIWFGLAGIDAAAALSNCYMGVYDAGGSLKAVSADMSPLLVTNPVAKPIPLATPFTATPGAYYIAMLLNGTWATNSLTFKSSGAGVSVNAGLSAGALRYSNMLTAQTSLPSTLTLSAQTTTIINTGWASQWYGVS